MPPEIQHAQPILDLMASEDLERDDQRVLHQVGVDGSVEDLNGAVVRSRCEQRISSVVGDCTQGFGVISRGKSRLVQVSR